MKKLIVCLLAALLALVSFGARADTVFTFNAYMGFKGEQVSVSVMQDGQNAGSKLLVRLDDGRQIGEITLTRAKGSRAVSCLIPADAQPGETLSLWLEGADAPHDTALLAAETRLGYSVTRVEREEKMLAITFDAANAAAKTRQILDLLDQYGAKCTFFVIGRYAINNPDITREIEARGHEVAGHSFDHPEMPSLTNDQILRDFSRTSAAFIDALGHDVALYRPPSGYSSQRDRAIARALGQEVIKWTIDSRDGFADYTLNTVIKRVQNNAKPGDIILMHVYGKHTLAALETLLPYYIEQGYALVTVSELLLEGDSYIDDKGVQRPLPPQAGS